MKRLTELTDDELNRLIAEDQGWSNIGDCTCCWGLSRGLPPSSKELKKHIPNYCQDLNAMHEAEKSLENSQVFDYMKNLVAIKKHPISEMGQLHTYLFHATARQRAEAYAITERLAL